MTALKFPLTTQLQLAFDPNTCYTLWISLHFPLQVTLQVFNKIKFDSENSLARRGSTKKKRAGGNLVMTLIRRLRFLMKYAVKNDAATRRRRYIHSTCKVLSFFYRFGV